MSCQLDVNVEDLNGSHEPQMTNVCLSVSNAEKMSKDMVLALGSTILAFIGLLFGAIAYFAVRLTRLRTESPMEP